LPRESNRPTPSVAESEAPVWRIRRLDLLQSLRHPARVRRAPRGSGPAAACAPGVHPRRARWRFRMAPGGRADSAHVGTGAPATPIEQVDTLSQYPVPDLGGAAVACVRGRRVALSHLRRSDDPARSSVAARHAAHSRWTRCRCGTSTAPRRRRPRHSRSRSATAVGPVPCDSGGAVALSGRSRSAIALSAPGRIGARRSIRGPRCASRPLVVRSEGRWNYLSVATAAYLF
jgi:hypothetical protein